MPSMARPRSFWLRGLALCWVLLMAELSLCAGMLWQSELAARESVQRERVEARYDAPPLDYPQYLRLSHQGRVDVRIDGRDVTLRLDDFTAQEMRVLLQALRAE